MILAKAWSRASEIEVNSWNYLQQGPNADSSTEFEGLMYVRRIGH
jgi:hypothetical protein